jgi:hypothetical protein
MEPKQIACLIFTADYIRKYAIQKLSGSSEGKTCVETVLRSGVDRRELRKSPTKLPAEFQPN